VVEDSAATPYKATQLNRQSDQQVYEDCCVRDTDQSMPVPIEDEDCGSCGSSSILEGDE
jgi:hypothetical protein